MKTVEELMTARFDLQLTNQQKGAFNSHPHVEIEYSSCLLIFLSLNEKLKFKLNSLFSFKKKKKRKRSRFFFFSTLNIYHKKNEWTNDTRINVSSGDEGGYD